MPELKFKPHPKEEETGYKQGIYKMGRCTVIVSINNNLWNISITSANQPSLKEVKEARYKFLPDNLHMVQIFPPKAELANQRDNRIDLHQI
jgi:hypothetical protein